MNAPTPPFNLPHGAPELALRLGLILAALVALIARRFVRLPHRAGITIILCRRLSRAAWRFMRALTRPARPPARAAEHLATDHRNRTKPLTASLPSGRGWLARELGYEARGLGAQLQALLAEPAMQAAVGDLPAVGRILRPICRMLGIAGPAPAVAEAAIDAAKISPPPVFWPSTLRAGGFATTVLEPDFAASG